MKKEEQMLCSHLSDLANACWQRDYAVVSDFLTLNEQSLFLSHCVGSLPPVSWSLEGGYDTAERKAVYFQPIGAGDQIPAPLVLLRAEPLNKKFAGDLTHRDYLGALMNLGIEREKIGDLILQDGGCLMICRDLAADIICSDLVRVGRTAVQCRRIAFTEVSCQPETKPISGTVASLRLDAVIGLAFSGSRSRLVSYIESEKVFVNGKCITSNAYQLKEGDLVSVRGLGKFRFVSGGGLTKKGRTSVSLELFI